MKLLSIPIHICRSQKQTITSQLLSSSVVDPFSCGRDRVIILWDLLSGTTVRTLPVFEGLEGLVLLPHKFRLPGCKKKVKGGIHIASAGERGNLSYESLNLMWVCLRTHKIGLQCNDNRSITSDKHSHIFIQEEFCSLYV
jgi:hypothetical protein